MKCPECGARTRVVHTQQKRDGAHRWLRCTSCGASARTLETYFNPEQTPPAAVLTPENVLDIRDRAASGDLQIDIAADYDLHPRTVLRIVNHQTWKDVR